MKISLTSLIAIESKNPSGKHTVNRKEINHNENLFTESATNGSK